MSDSTISNKVIAEARATPASIPSLRARDGATCMAISATQHPSDLLGTSFPFSPKQHCRAFPHQRCQFSPYLLYLIGALMPEARHARAVAEPGVGAHRIQAARLHDSLKLELVTGDEASAQQVQRSGEEVSEDYGAQKEDPGCWQPSRCPAGPIPRLHTQDKTITSHGLIAAQDKCTAGKSSPKGWNVLAAGNHRAPRCPSSQPAEQWIPNFRASVQSVHSRQLSHS